VILFRKGGEGGHFIKSNKFPVVFFKIFIDTNLKLLLTLFHEFIENTVDK